MKKIILKLQNNPIDMNMETNTTASLIQREPGLEREHSEKAKRSKFIDNLRNIVLVATILIAGASAVFIMVNVYTFAIEAYQTGQGADELSSEVVQDLLLLVCKFAMLLMFTIALIIGSLIPLALMYVIMIPMKQKQKED